MPIKNITLRGLRFPRLGTIRKGIKQPITDDNGKPRKNSRGQIMTRPAEVAWWVFHTDPGDPATLDTIRRIYGEQPIQLSVFLPFPVAQQNFDYWLEAYTFSQLVARSDGEVITWLRDITNGQTLIRDGIVTEEPLAPTSAAGRLCAGRKGKAVPYAEGMAVAMSEPDGGKSEPITFKAAGRLQVVLPELQRLATFTVMTGAGYDIQQFMTMTEFILPQINQATGRAANTVPLILRRAPREISVPGKDGKRMRVMKYMGELEVDPRFSDQLMLAYDRAPVAMLGNGQQRMLEGEILGTVEDGDSYGPPDPADVAADLRAEAEPTGPDLPPHDQPIRSAYTIESLAAIVNAQLAPDLQAAADMLEQSSLPISGVPTDHAVRWARVFRAALDKGQGIDEAVSAADKAYARFMRAQQDKE